MYKIGIVGHCPENLTVFSEEKTKGLIKEVIDTLSYQYGFDVIFNVIGKVGIGLWTAEECTPQFPDYIRLHRYHLFLPFPQEITSEDWFDEQKELLKKCCDNAWTITICNAKKTPLENGYSTYKELVHDSNFVIFFWTGKKQGKTFETIRYALENNKLSLNALKDLRLITNKDIK